MCIWTKKSMTHAVKAKRVLLGAGIPCEVVNLEAGMTEKGCAYGVSLPCGMIDEARRVLKRHDLDYGEIIGK